MYHSIFSSHASMLYRAVLCQNIDELPIDLLKYLIFNEI